MVWGLRVSTNTNFNTCWTDETKALAFSSLIGVVDVSSVPLLLQRDPLAVMVLVPAPFFRRRSGDCSQFLFMLDVDHYVKQKDK